VGAPGGLAWGGRMGSVSTGLKASGSKAGLILRQCRGECAVGAGAAFAPCCAAIKQIGRALICMAAGDFQRLVSES